MRLSYSPNVRIIRLPCSGKIDHIYVLRAFERGVDGVFVGSGIFKSGDPAKRGAAIVKAVTHYDNPEILAEVSRNLGEPMVGRNVFELEENERLAERGW